MMWNFLVAGLASGCALVLYDGSPLREPAFLWELVDVLGITIFGTSAKYLDQLSVCSSFLVMKTCMRDEKLICIHLLPLPCRWYSVL